MKLYETLIAQLKCENDFVSDNGEVKKWVVADKARNYDSKLLALLLANDDLRNAFFKDVNSTTIFLLDKFLLFIEQKNYLNDSYTAYRNKIGLTIGGKFLNHRNEVELVWPYKDCILEGGQTKEDQKRPEIFFNQTLAQDEITQLLDPKVLTGYKRYGTFADDALFHRDAKLNANRGLSANTITDNLIIKGNNLLALHCLKKEFAGKVKLIYIDPPYNTGNDSFGYNDNFNHSTWLTFIKNRLEVARKLLREDGVIFVQCDDSEHAYLKVLMDEIFGRDNFVNSVSVRSSTPSGVKTAHREKTIIKTKDHILVYAKISNLLKLKSQYIKKEKWDTHYNSFLDRNTMASKSLVEVMIENGLLQKGNTINDINLNNKEHRKFYLKFADCIYQTAPEIPKEQKEISLNNPNKIISYYDREGNMQFAFNGRRLTFLSQTIKPILIGASLEKDISNLLCDFWGDIDFQNTQNQGGVDFDNAKKPEQLIYRIIDMTTNENDIVLDFFAGSGTTAAVAHKMNRQYITCEQIDNQMDLIITRLQNVVNGDQSGISKSVGWNPQNPTLEDSSSGHYNRNNFIYLELKKYNQTFIERIEATKDTEALLQIWEQMKEKSFLAYNVDIKSQESNMEEFMQLDLAQQKEVLCELLDKNQLYVNLSDMNDIRFETTAEEREVTEAFYSKKQ
ncbi:MAG: site-specific DNA-methyltransferase [Bacteroidales bacterium]|nr:site-specific DNA-methyltransferase [Bacteroidales bacterium]